jgi:hypothetical protein
MLEVLGDHEEELALDLPRNPKMLKNKSTR